MTAISEAAFQSRVLDLLKLRGYRRVHIRPARTEHGWRTPYEGDPGLPDVIAAKDGRVLLIELKSMTGRFRPGQPEWLAALGEHGRLYRPSDWDQVMEDLR